MMHPSVPGEFSPSGHSCCQQQACAPEKLVHCCHRHRIGHATHGLGDGRQAGCLHNLGRVSMQADVQGTLLLVVHMAMRCWYGLRKVRQLWCKHGHPMQAAINRSHEQLHHLAGLHSIWHAATSANPHQLHRRPLLPLPPLPHSGADAWPQGPPRMLLRSLPFALASPGVAWWTLQHPRSV